MTIQNNPHSVRIRQFVASELFSLMLDVAAAYNSRGYESYCTIVLARNARVSHSLAHREVSAEIQRRRPVFARSWTVSSGHTAGGAA